MTHIMLTNAIVASVAAMAVFFCSRILRNPALLHVLWLAVILRLLAPPILVVPLTHATFNRSNGRWYPEIAIRDDAYLPNADDVLRPMPDVMSPVLSNWDLLVAAWILGASSVFIAIVVRTLMFTRLIRLHGFEDERLQHEVQRLCIEMGLTSAPTLRIVNARISPMVWALFNRPMLLVPAELWNRLSPDEKTAVLRHELAHVIRRDHWVRCFEMLATITHWWCPVLWWARRELHRYEERCCDAWAVSFESVGRESLARACLQTIDFLSRENSRRGNLAATRMTGYTAIRSRLEFILDGEAAPLLGRITAKHAAGLMLLMCVTPVIGQAGASTTVRAFQSIAVAKPFEELKVKGPVNVVVRPGIVPAVSFQLHDGVRPDWEFDGRGMLTITLNSSGEHFDEVNRPQFIVTVPGLVRVEAYDHATVSLEGTETESLLLVAAGESRITSVGRCESLSVNALDSGSLWLSKLQANRANVDARHNSVVALGNIHSLIQRSDATSQIQIDR